MDAVSTNQKIAKLGQKRSYVRHVTHFWNFRPPNISVRMKLETSNLAERWRAVRTNENTAKLGQRWSFGGHMTHFWNYGTPNIYGTNEDRKFKLGIEMDGSEY